MRGFLIGLFVVCALGCVKRPMPAHIDLMTDEEKATMCGYAQMGFALSSPELENPKTLTGHLYWKAYKEGVAKGLPAYCLKP